MFDDPAFQKHDFQHIPLDCDLFVMGGQWMEEYEKAWREVFAGSDRNPAEVGYISYAAARAVRGSVIELSWYANIIDRFHEVRVSLPKAEFITCVECRDYDDKPRIFVRDAWVEQLYLRAYSVFALVDAIGVKRALISGRITRKKLLQLRDRIDDLARSYPDISFISFADSLLLKSNWTVGTYDSTVQYSYSPEVFIQVINEIGSVYHEILGMNVYAILTQGSNEFYNDPLLHISRAGHHVSLNSLGLPFAQLMSIDRAVKQALEERIHGPAEMYLDESYYHSLKFRHQFHKHNLPKASYLPPMSDGEHFYFYSARKTIMDNLQSLGHRPRRAT